MANVLTDEVVLVGFEHVEGFIFTGQFLMNLCGAAGHDGGVCVPL